MWKGDQVESMFSTRQHEKGPRGVGCAKVAVALSLSGKSSHLFV